MVDEVEVDLYKEDGLALSWEKKQEALRRVREGSPVKVSPTGKVGSRTICSVETPDLQKDASESSSEEFSESEQDLTWEEWEKQNAGKLTALTVKKKTEPDDRKVPEEITDRMKKFQESLNEFANQDWLKNNSANNFGKPKEEPKPKAKKSTEKKKKKKSKDGTKKSKKKKVSASKAKKREELPEVDQDDNKERACEEEPVQIPAEAKPMKPATEEIDVNAIRNLSLELSDTKKSSQEEEAALAAEFDGEASLQEILREPEHPKFGSSSRLSHNSSFNGSGSLNGSQNFKVKIAPARADHATAFDMSWQEKQREILRRRASGAPAVKVVPPTKESVPEEKEESEMKKEIVVIDEKKKQLWASARKQEKKKTMEDHESGFRLTWEQKQQIIADKRLAEGN